MSFNELVLRHEGVSYAFQLLEKGESFHTLSKDLVHKSRTDNVFVKDIKRVGSYDAYDIVVALLHIPTDHAYFFEHPKDHIPGLMLIDAAKQAGTAICHSIYQVDMQQVFILDDMTIRFLRLAELNADVFLHIFITEKKYRKDNQLSALQAEGYFYQCDKKMAYMKSSWKIIDPVIFNRLRLR